MDDSIEKDNVNITITSYDRSNTTINSNSTNSIKSSINTTTIPSTTTTPPTIPTTTNAQYNNTISPLDNMNPYNLINRIFLTWMSPLMKLGTTKILEANDIFCLPNQLKSSIILKETKQAYYNELSKSKNTNKKVYIEYVLLKLYGSGLIVAFISTIPFMIATLLQPYFIEAIMLSISSNNTSSFIGINDGIYVAILLGIISTISIVFFNQAAYNNCFVGVKIRTAILNMIFDKALRLSVASKALHRSGEIMTLIAADPERLWQSVIVSTWLFIGPINVILAMSLLLYEVGVSALAALAAMIIVLFVQAKSSLSIGIVRSKLVQYTDERTKIMNEVLSGIRVAGRSNENLS